MKSPGKLRLLCALILVLCSWPVSAAQVAASDQASLVDLLKAYYAAYSQKDLAALVRFWSERSPDLAISTEEAERKADRF